MARVSTQAQLGRRDLLVIAWRPIPELLGLLSPAAQWELHRIYAPSRDLTDEQFLQHMKRALAREPSLAQRAGKHHKQTFDAFKFYADQVGKTEWEFIGKLVAMEYQRDHADLTQRRPIAIMAIVKPEPDSEKIAKALLRLAERESRAA